MLEGGDDKEISDGFFDDFDHLLAPSRSYAGNPWDADNVMGSMIEADLKSLEVIKGAEKSNYSITDEMFDG